MILVLYVVNSFPTAIFIDACSKANLISRKFLDKFIKNYQIVGKSRSKIRQATIDDVSRVYDIVRLSVKLSPVEFISEFKITDNDDPYYDAIINFKTKSDNRIFIDTIDKVLAYKNIDGSLIPVVDVEDIKTFRAKSLLCCSDEFIDIVEATLFVNSEIDNFKDNTSEKEKAIDSIVNKINFKNILDYNKFIRLIKSYKDIIAIFSDDLEPSKLLPHYIVLEDNTSLIKQAPYKMSQVQTEALKEEPRKLIEKKLIEPSHSPWA